jgi:UDP-GlcNAc:undecaprenyl-phosphate GlcNAc-1-phosphate transferase
MSDLLLQAILAFTVTLILIKALSAVAPRVGLVDRPDHRKKHSGAIPLVGGVAIYLSLLLGAVLWGKEGLDNLSTHGKPVSIFLLAGGILVFMGVVDDIRQTGVFVRVITEIAVALLIIEGLGLRANNLGDLIGTGHVSLEGWIAYPFTVVCVFGIINAYNMLDGMDGVLGIIGLITLFGFHLFTDTVPGFITVFISMSLIAFLVSNLGLWPAIPKTFLGDSGSKLMGLIVVSLILTVADADVAGLKYIEPVTALYLVGLPLYDMTFTTLRRIFRGQSPIKPDRSHIHHLMQELGLSDRRGLLVISTLGLSSPLLGLMLARSGASTPYQFYIFVGLFLLYCVLMQQAWVVAERRQPVSPAQPRATLPPTPNESPHDS